MAITTRRNEIHVFHPPQGTPDSAELLVRDLRAKVQERLTIYPRVLVVHYMDRLETVDESYVRPFGQLGKQMKEFLEAYDLGEIAYIVCAEKARHRVLAYFGAMLAGVEIKVFKERAEIDDLLGARPPVPPATEPEPTAARRARVAS